MFSIPTTAKNPKEAYRFIRYYTTDGAYIRAGGLIAEKKVDLKTIIPKIVGDNPDKLYDMNSLYSTLQNPKLQLNTPMTVPAYNSEINSMFIEEMEKFLVSGETLKECISNMTVLGNDIVQKAKYNRINN
jgi:multiple sugar transport system substrate-binding protein